VGTAALLISTRLWKTSRDHQRIVQLAGLESIKERT